jgi:VIT1/CCC1 family predicted Fe2+/Mn2+ transporter
LAPAARLTYFVAALSLVFLAILGAIAARIGRARVLTGALRITFWGAIAMGLTAAVGRLFGVIA